MIARPLACALLALAPILPAAELACQGVLGNSGACGEALVRCTTPVPNLGVCIDRWKTLWERGGKGVLNRYAVDGRLLAQFPIPPSSNQRDRAVIAGDDLVLLLDGKLWRLPLDAPAGAKPSEVTGVAKADIMAPSAWKGRVLVGTTAGMSWVDPRSGATSVAGPAIERLDGLECDAQGTVYIQGGSKLHAFRDGTPLPGWPRDNSGSRPQLIDGRWYGQAYHSTVYRYDGELRPAPGVVLGGNSGSFIGHVYEDPEIDHGRGLARLDGDEWVLSSYEHGLYLLTWDQSGNQFSITRRIGGLAAPNALAIDDEGRVSLGFGYWLWADPPDAPLRESSGAGAQAVADLGKNRFVLLADNAGGRLRAGPLKTWEKMSGGEKQGVKVPKSTVGAAAVPIKGGFDLVAVTAKGEAYGAVLSSGGEFREWRPSVAIALKQPVLNGWTAIDRLGDGLVAAVGGSVVMLERDGAGWRERERWRSWGRGAQESFGASVWIDVDGDRLWVADRENHRVVCFDAARRTVLATFGVSGTPGTDLARLSAPERLAAAAGRCVVYDAGNQRLVKLELR
jgi:hypothetical protein